MFKRFTLVCLVLLVAPLGVAENPPQLRASGVFAWPPAFSALFGDPVIVTKRGMSESGRARVFGGGSYHSFDGIRRPKASAKVFLYSRGSLSPAEVQHEAAEALARKFFRLVLNPNNLSTYEKRMKMGELIPMDEEVFVELAREQLLEGSSSEDVRNAWWTVRMGLPGTPDPGRRLVILNQHFDHNGEKETHGHFCFGIRKEGGDPNEDRVYDFRAPWFEDRNPRLTEAVNLHGRLQLSGFTENMYDWLYTQTEYRNCYVNLWFLPVTQEQVKLLSYFWKRGEPHVAGDFRPFRKNCASLGLLFYDRILPINTELIAARAPSVDLPVAVAEKIVEPVDEAVFYLLPNVTDERGREPTAKSFVHTPQPSRASSRPFRKLATVPGAN